MIPERYKAEYECYCEPGSFEAQIVEELGAAESKVSEQAATIERIERLTEELSEFEGKLTAAHVTLGQLTEAFHDESAQQAATIAELEEFKKSVLDNCTGCGYSLFLPQEPK